jgi:hypothetical protein
MRRVRANIEAAKKYGARIFLFPRTYTSGVEYRSALIAARHRLLRFAKKIPPPNFVRITKDGMIGYFQKDAEARSTPRGKTNAKYGEVVSENAS